MVSTTAKRLPIAACTPRIRRRKREPLPLPLPGFDAPQVTQEDIARWLVAVPRIAPDSPRAAAYIRGYDVAGKIARARAEGRLEAILSGAMMRDLDPWPPKEKPPL